MIVVGITGLIGSGKSTVLNFFKEKGALTFSSDDYVNELNNSNEELVSKIAKVFPQAVENNIVNKIKLKQFVFLDYENNIKILESIYHPYVINKIKHIISHNKFFFWKILAIEVPLLFETGLDKLCNYIVVSDCEEKIRVDRIKNRSFVDDNDLKKIIDKQGSIDSKIKLADFVIDTSVSLEDVELKVEEIFNKIKFSTPIFNKFNN